MKGFAEKIYLTFVFLFFISILLYLRVFKIATEYCIKAILEIYLIKIGVN